MRRAGPLLLLVVAGCFVDYETSGDEASTGGSSGQDGSSATRGEGAGSSAGVDGGRTTGGTSAGSASTTADAGSSSSDEGDEEDD